MFIDILSFGHQKAVFKDIPLTVEKVDRMPAYRKTKDKSQIDFPQDEHSGT